MPDETYALFGQRFGQQVQFNYPQGPLATDHWSQVLKAADDVVAGDKDRGIKAPGKAARAASTKLKLLR